MARSCHCRCVLRGSWACRRAVGLVRIPLASVTPAARFMELPACGFRSCDNRSAAHQTWLVLISVINNLREHGTHERIMRVGKLPGTCETEARRTHLVIVFSTASTRSGVRYGVFVHGLGGVFLLHAATHTQQREREALHATAGRQSKPWQQGGPFTSHRPPVRSDSDRRFPCRRSRNSAGRPCATTGPAPPPRRTGPAAWPARRQAGQRT